MSHLTPADLHNLRVVAEAAKQQMLTGPKEWPGTPSAQRLALFLAATPDVVLQLVAMAENCQADHPATPTGQAMLWGAD